MFEERSLYRLTFDQIDLVNRPLQSQIFLEGFAGCGKTTAAVERILRTMAEGIPGSSILLFVPQRVLAKPYLQALSYPGVVSGGEVNVLTPAALAQRMVERYWSGVAQLAGFGRPDQPPKFLSSETAQFYMAHLITPLIHDGYFESLTMDRNRIFSQILDTLSKAAVVGFPYSEIGDRLRSAWTGEPGHLRLYDDVQECANLFRRYCFEHNLLDFSLYFEVFRDFLWPDPSCRDYLRTSYRHLVFDNIEEAPPVVHDMLQEWLPDFDSALLIYDLGAGVRRFLVADPQTAYQLRETCSENLGFSKPLVMSPAVESLHNHLSSFLSQRDEQTQFGFDLLTIPIKQFAELPETYDDKGLIRDALVFEQHQYYPDMLEWVANQIEDLIFDKGVPPGEIVVLSPYLRDSLRFSILHRLENRQIPVRSYRPSRSLREEPATRCLLTLTGLAYPEWDFLPTKFDVAQALMQAISGLDRIRAQLLTEIIYRIHDGIPALSSFELIKPKVQERITYLIGERYEELRAWLSYKREPPDEFDVFLSRLFDEILSKPGFGFEGDLIAREVTANLIDSFQKFRSAVGPSLSEEGLLLGREFVEMIEQGVLPDLYLRNWQPEEKDAVQVIPAFTYLVSNQPVRYQFWIDVGSRSWSERLVQPLTHAYVLTREWAFGRAWTDVDDVRAGQDFLESLALGLLRRCREKVYLGISELGDQGYEARGPLLQALQRVMLSSGA